jgi:hypothetical protein
VIGPRVSEHFLLLKNQFKNALVLSPYATATEVYKLPDNFYTLSVSAEYSADKTFEYMQTFKPNRVFIFNDLECKTCADFGIALKNQLLLAGIKVVNVDFVGDNLKTRQIQYKKI